MPFDIQALTDGVIAFYLSINVLGALGGTMPGALVERKACATLERVHFLMFFFGGAALLGYLQFEIDRSMAPENLTIANFVLAVVAGLYLGNVAARRLRNAAKKPVLALLIWVPVVNLVFLAALALIPTAPKKAKPLDSAQSDADAGLAQRS